MANLALVVKKVYPTYDTDSSECENVIFRITTGGDEIGVASVLVNDKSAYVDGIEIYERVRGRGYGTKAIRLLARLYDSVYLSPDNAEAQRLYSRLGTEYHGDEYPDFGYGTYEVRKGVIK